jgi:aminoglycoside 3-N-acetyltransferase
MTDPYRGEADAMARTRGPPPTRSSLATDLRRLGLVRGATVLVHSSLSALGWVVGGAEAVVLSLEDVIGVDGTLMMPAYSVNAPEPSLWKNPPAPASWWESIRSDWPPYDPDLSPPNRLGKVADTFRGQRGNRRSYHPNHSFCARGPNAAQLLDHHALDDSMGEASPLARLYDLHGEVLLLGVDHSSNSSIHLAEYRAQWPGKRGQQPRRARGVRNGAIVELSMTDLDLNSDDFGVLGAQFETDQRAVRTGPVGGGTGRLMDQRTLVDYAVGWMAQHRT